MSTPTQTPAEFWAGDFGAEYHQRNRDRGRVRSNASLFAEIFRHIPNPPNLILELGCGEGYNLEAIAGLIPTTTDLWGFEINAAAAARATDNARRATIVTGDALTLRLPFNGRADMVLTKGFLIHVPPEQHAKAAEAIWYQSARWILMCEYYNPTLVHSIYRGYEGRMWKRDWPKMFSEMGPHELLAYGFRYHGDPVAPQDDLTWFLIEKK